MSYIVSLNPDVQTGTVKLNVEANPAMDYNPIRGEVGILLVPSCYHEPPPNGLLGSYVDLTFSRQCAILTCFCSSSE